MSGSEVETAPAEISVSDMKVVMATILDVVECPVCYQELQSPIYQCNNGHPVCARCRPRVRACPVCKSWMYHVRALSLEKILREMPRPCRYAADGCPARLGTACRARHERACPIRPAHCVEALVACAWNGPLTEARAHLALHHDLESRLHPAMMGRFRFSIGCQGQEKFLEDEADGLLFRCLIRSERDRLHFLCHALAPAERAADYVFRVLVTQNCSDRRLSYEGPVSSVFQSVAKTIEAGHGMWLGREWLMSICTCHKKRRHCFDTTWQLVRKADLQSAAVCQAILSNFLEARGVGLTRLAAMDRSGLGGTEPARGQTGRDRGGSGSGGTEPARGQTGRDRGGSGSGSGGVEPTRA